MVFSIDLLDASIDGNSEMNSSKQSTLLFKRSNSADESFVRLKNSLSYEKKKIKIILNNLWNIFNLTLLREVIMLLTEPVETFPEKL